MKIWRTLAIAALLAALPDMPAAAQDAAAPNGLHPDAHGPDAAPPAAPQARVEPQTVTVVARTRHRRRWRATVGHVRRCKRRFRTYNPRTNLYVARAGLRRRCVL